MKDRAGRFSQAIARRPGPDMGRGLTTAGLGPPDHEKALRQHDAYLTELHKAGLSVTLLDRLDGHPDAYFIEDAAVLMPDWAILTRPGAEGRRSEAAALAPVLAALMPTDMIEAPGTLDGGDVLLTEREALIGLSDRTNRQGACQLQKLFERRGLQATLIEVEDGLHLKSDINWVAENTLLVTPRYADHPALRLYRRIQTAPGESAAANSLRINDRLLVPQGFPRTRDRLAQVVPLLVELDVSEMRKMDGGLTCLSLRY